VFRYITTEKILSAYADYDEPEIVRRKNFHIVDMCESLDYKMKVTIFQKNKFYRQSLTFNDDDSITISTKLVYSLD